MAHRLIIQPNGRYAVYSTNSGIIILSHCTRGELIELYAREEGAKSRTRTAEWVHAPRPQSKHHSVEDAVSWFADRGLTEEAEEVRRQLNAPPEDDTTIECQSQLYRVVHWIRSQYLPDTARNLMYPFQDKQGGWWAELTADQVVRMSEHFDVMIEGPGEGDDFSMLWLDDKGQKFQQR